MKNFNESQFVKRQLEQLIMEVWKLAAGPGGQTSTSKTDKLHNGFGEILKKYASNTGKKLKGRYLTKNEFKVKKKRSEETKSVNWTVPCAYGDVFSLDAVITKQIESPEISQSDLDMYKKSVHNTIDTIFLFKAIMTGYNQNRFNCANTIIGEASRVYDASGQVNKDKNICFVNFIPKKTCAHEGKTIQENNLIKTDPIIKKRFNEESDKITIIDIYYDLKMKDEDIKNWKERVKTLNDFIDIDEEIIVQVINFFNSMCDE